MEKGKLKVVYTRLRSNSQDPFWLKVLKFIVRALIRILQIFVSRQKYSSCFLATLYIGRGSLPLPRPFF